MPQQILREPGLATMRATFLRLAELSDQATTDLSDDAYDAIQRERHACAYELASTISPLLNRLVTAEWMGDMLYHAVFDVYEGVATAEKLKRLSTVMTMWRDGATQGVGRTLAPVPDR